MLHDILCVSIKAQFVFTFLPGLTSWNSVIWPREKKTNKQTNEQEKIVLLETHLTLDNFFLIWIVSGLKSNLDSFRAQHNRTKKRKSACLRNN